MKLRIGLILVGLLTGNAWASPVQSGSNRCSVPKIATSINDFGSDLVKQIDENGNIFISPLSIYATLGLIHLGSGGQIAKQIENAFRLGSLGLNPAQLHTALRELLGIITRGNDEYSLLAANAVFAQQDYNINPKYIDNVRSLYDAVAKLVDFENKGEEAKNEINKWAADNTKNKIPELLKEPLEPSTKLVLANAIYFKGTWKTQFDAKYTREGTFYGTTQTKVKYMTLLDVDFNYYVDWDTKYKFLELPYKGEHIKMLLTLPLEQNGPLDLEMTTSRLCSIRESLTNTSLTTVVIPKFKIEYQKDLKEALIGLGIEDAFSSSADLSGIREENDLEVSKVQHASVLEVNEEGSEAAAVTIGVIQDRAGFDVPDFYATHPFLVHIIDSRSGIVLFSGKIVNP